jgi:hypothetical protein
MKQKFLIYIGLGLLTLVIAFILKDLFFQKSSNEKSPYDYDLSALQNPDSLKSAWEEILSFRPQMEEIHAVAVDRYDRIFVGGKDYIEIFNQNGDLLKRIETRSTALCLSFNPDDQLIAGMEDHLEFYNMKGDLLTKWPQINKESIITSVAADAENIFVADAGMTTVYHYDKNGKLLGRIGDKDPKKGIPGYVVPSPYFDLSIFNANALWVANPGRHSLEEYDFLGNPKSRWGIASMTVDGFCGCCNPSNFVRMKDGAFVTSEKGIERIKIYEKDGRLREVVAFPEAFTEGTQGLDLAVDAENRIIVLDPGKKMVRVFIRKSTTKK